MSGTFKDEEPQLDTWLGSVMSMAGCTFIAFEAIIIGLVLYTIGSLFFMIFNYRKGVKSQLLMHVYFTIFNIIGLYNWTVRG